MGIKWKDYITNTEVLERAQLQSIESMLMLRQLRWAGHVARVPDSRMPKAMFYGELAQGKHNKGAPQNRFKDQLKRQLLQADIDPKTWEQSATNRVNWRAATHKGTQHFEEKRREKRRKWKDPEPQLDNADQIFTCPHCDRP